MLQVVSGLDRDFATYRTGATYTTGETHYATSVRGQQSYVTNQPYSGGAVGTQMSFVSGVSGPPSSGSGKFVVPSSYSQGATGKSGDQYQDS